MNSIYRFFAVLFVCPAVACGSSDDDGDSTLNHYNNEIAEAATALEQSTSAHSQLILEQQDLQRMHQIEQQYTEDMTVGIGHMWDACDSMQTCGAFIGMQGPSQPGPRFDSARTAMSEDIDDVSAELDRHWTAMQGTASVDAAWAEEEQHQLTMNGFMDHMWMSEDMLGIALEEMMEQGFSMICPMTTHMHHAVNQHQAR